MQDTARETTDARDADDAHKAVRKACATELWLGLAARSVNIYVCPFLLICISLMMLKCGLPEDAWVTLRMLHVLRSKEWISQFASDLASRLRTRLQSAEDISWNVRLVVGDNCSYLIRTVHQHVDRKGEYLHTVNWFSVPIRASVLGGQRVARGAWRMASFGRYAIRPLFDPLHAASTNLKNQAWRGFMGVALQGGDILGRPDVPKPERSEMIFEEPIMDAGTAAYSDVDRWLGAVKRMYLFLITLPILAVSEAASMVMAVGDQQTWSRMLWLKLYHPSRYDWLLPLPGEFHFTYHALMAMHILCCTCNSLVYWAIHELACVSHYGSNPARETASLPSTASHLIGIP